MKMKDGLRTRWAPFSAMGLNISCHGRAVGGAGDHDVVGKKMTRSMRGRERRRIVFRLCWISPISVLNMARSVTGLANLTLL